MCLLVHFRILFVLNTVLSVIKTFEKELIAEGAGALKPLYRVDLADGVALPDEETSIVANRSGSILSASTILKNDLFLGLQKMTLPEYYVRRSCHHTC